MTSRAAFVPASIVTHLLGLVAMIVSGTRAHQCDNWYVSNWGRSCHSELYLERCSLELAQRSSRAALASHNAAAAKPQGQRYSRYHRQLSEWCYLCPHSAYALQHHSSGLPNFFFAWAASASYFKHLCRFFDYFFIFHPACKLIQLRHVYQQRPTANNAIRSTWFSMRRHGCST